ncbi:MAG TPA: PAS domain S-box protein [Fimbriimonadaceae bacterium]|nr:PAS domain S-box protein [Fimbriimonadaceae bacterium]
MERRRKTELSEREKQLIQLAAEGHTDASIANHLGISEATVSTYWGRVRIKIGPYSRPELIATVIRDELDQVVSELREQNEQLIAELQKSTGREWGDPEANYYRKLVLQAPDAILIVNEDGIMETVNDEAAALFGYEREELEGQILHTLVPERYKKIHMQHREEYMLNPQKRKMAEHSASLGLHKSGDEFPIAASLSPVETASGVRVMCIVRRVSRAYTG